jgi:hypothetical protein
MQRKEIVVLLSLPSNEELLSVHQKIADLMDSKWLGISNSAGVNGDTVAPILTSKKE